MENNAKEIDEEKEMYNLVVYYLRSRPEKIRQIIRFSEVVWKIRTSLEISLIS